MNNVIKCYKTTNYTWRAYYEKNPGNQAWGSSKEIAIRNLMALQNPSLEDLVGSIKRYVTELEERITCLEIELGGDPLYPTDIRNVRDTLLQVKNTLLNSILREKIR